MDKFSQWIRDHQGTTGCAIAQRLTSALTCNGIPYQRLVEIVYGEMRDIAAEQKRGDWLEMPDGTTYTLTYKPEREA